MNTSRTVSPPFRSARRHFACWNHGNVTSRWCHADLQTAALLVLSPAPSWSRCFPCSAAIRHRLQLCQRLWLCHQSRSRSTRTSSTTCHRRCRPVIRSCVADRFTMAELTSSAVQRKSWQFTANYVVAVNTVVTTWPQPMRNVRQFCAAGCFTDRIRTVARLRVIRAVKSVSFTVCFKCLWRISKFFFFHFVPLCQKCFFSVD